MELYELRQRQSLPLEAKITMSLQRIREWHEHWDGQVYVSFSGGKDSSVLLHLVRSLYPEVPAAFVDTGLEFPAIRSFVRSVENVIWLRPEKRFQEIVQEYGYPVVSKDIARSVYYARKGSNWALHRFQGQNSDGTPSQWYASRQKKWKKLLDAPFKISDMCCHWMKERPLLKLERELRPFIGILATGEPPRICRMAVMRLMQRSPTPSRWVSGGNRTCWNISASTTFPMLVRSMARLSKKTTVA